eukprot:gnl/TRDRNA2_/TRDRNA2_136257_c0_seq3.p1 gnl/TRDRNA2_/TRDRNA2_136257_c0~~gnl/TRDRNA2_/TRDRNA2_136257_c0_seq3.p1  ORF type:complete len:219 (-),score=36.58 gnl/TRDRNA2_/TRDRNA2_136257_c0_seq3:69-725(-)
MVRDSAVTRSYELIEREETDSMLEKSRGEFRMLVRRNAEPYLMGILLPEIFMVIISWSVFWLPLIAPFAMPRVATALIAFLTLMTLSLRTNAMLPVRGDVSWLDLVESNCSGLMFYNVVFNVCCLVLYHQFDEKKLAETIDREMIVIYAAMVLVLAGLCLYATHGEELHIVALVCMVLRSLFGCGYVGLCIYRLHNLRKERLSEAEATQSAPVSSMKQ